MKCIICHQDSGKSDCCKKCQSFHTAEQIDSVRQSKAEAEKSRAQLEGAMEAMRASNERQREENLRALRRGYF